MAKNKTLNAAARANKDEFYTRLEDIENELKHYRSFFKDKIVLCNCDDPYKSNFFRYFVMNFETLELKKLIVTCYDGSPISFFDKPVELKKAFKVEINSVKDLNQNGAINPVDVELLIKGEKNSLTLLKGNGDFRSQECIEILKQADVVVTNPPFSLFREYVAQLIKYDKKFLIIGNINAITYKRIFPFIKDDKIWLGHGFKGGDPCFSVPDNYEERSTRFWIDADGKKWRSFGNVCWFTNIRTSKFEETIPLIKKYYETPEMFPRYDTYDAIEVSKTADIPADYFGVMGVPITFLDKYNPKQFEIVGKIDTGKIDEYNLANPIINGKAVYKRIAIRRRVAE